MNRVKNFVQPQFPALRATRTRVFRWMPSAAILIPPPGQNRLAPLSVICPTSGSHGPAPPSIPTAVHFSGGNLISLIEAPVRFQGLSATRQARQTLARPSGRTGPNRTTQVETTAIPPRNRSECRIDLRASLSKTGPVRPDSYETHKNHSQNRIMARDTVADRSRREGQSLPHRDTSQKTFQRLVCLPR